MTLSDYVRILGRGPSKSRALTRDEAQAAMALILSGNVEPEAVGALLMLMRYRGESPDEVAGFVDAFRSVTSEWSGAATLGRVDLDWPSYAAGRSRGLPLFLLSAKLLAKAGYRIFLHGWNSHQKPGADVRSALDPVGIPCADIPAEAGQFLNRYGLCYVPLEAMDARLLALLRLRDVLGLRSAVNTCLRLLNPSGAAAAVQGAFHPPYRPLQRDASRLTGLSSLAVIKGAGGEFEWTGMKPLSLFRLVDGTPSEEEIPACNPKQITPSQEPPNAADLVALWQGGAAGSPAVDTIIATAALALGTLDPSQSRREAQAWASTLWQDRHAIGPDRTIPAAGVSVP